MAEKTSIALRNLFFYQVFVRQFSETHDFHGLIKQLDRLKSLNIDVIQLLPIHPIGQLKRKGTVGSPYSISDYYEINPDLGTLDDFTLLLAESHKRGMKVIIDIVFNHTSHDAKYTKTHPHWYYHKADGSFANRVGDWWDIIDFNFENNEALEKELINVLIYWTKIGVDGFRCDVAPLLPLRFWKKARQELETVNPNLIYVSESVHLSFIKYLRDLAYDAFSDSEIFQVFDVCYDYDIFDDFQNYFQGKGKLKTWITSLIRQESSYPKNYVKLRYLENHDMERLAKYLKTDSQLRTVNAMLFFLKGIPFIYNGQECGAHNRPDLFEIDEIDWQDYNRAGIVDIIKKVGALRKQWEFVNWKMEINQYNSDTMEIKYTNKTKTIVGIFNLGAKPRPTKLQYAGINQITGEPIKRGTQVISEPIIVVI
ncbi:MAG TPA: alpha-amylase family glycosyl hydrolase [Bacilli bacterium]|nr:MAG: Alpha-amylase precursor [Tenericutes bacterium ADurb.BinA124]HPN60628.1 alpha-amylase family glycosyl hydrolase [Bacilli bacterium]HPX85003.1 alpha-amylase family glycosyl hydrolase [Bacilli bacterium]